MIATNLPGIILLFKYDFTIQICFQWSVDILITNSTEFTSANLSDDSEPLRAPTSDVALITMSFNDDLE